MNVHEEIIIAGFGGQGILFTGKLLCEAGMGMGLNVTYLPSYGAEVRGGTAHCHVILSNNDIPSPVVANPTSLLIMNEPSLKKFEKKLKPSGLLVLNSSLISDGPMRSDIEVLSVPAADIAVEIGNVKVSNMVMLGCYMAGKNVLSKESIVKGLPAVLSVGKESLVDLNIRAFDLGYRYLMEGKEAEFSTDI